MVANWLWVAPVQAQNKFTGVPLAEQPFVDQNEISGAVMLVATKDKILHLSAVGRSDLASGRKLETGDFFWIASMTKPVTAVCVGLLVDGKRVAVHSIVSEATAV